MSYEWFHCLLSGYEWLFPHLELANLIIPSHLPTSAVVCILYKWFISRTVAYILLIIQHAYRPGGLEEVACLCLPSRPEWCNQCLTVKTDTDTDKLRCTIACCHHYQGSWVCSASLSHLGLASAQRPSWLPFELQGCYRTWHILQIDQSGPPN